MEWVQFIIFFLGVFGLFIWNRTESRNDIRHMDNKLDGQRALIQAIWQESKNSNEKWSMMANEFNDKWIKETKEFNDKWIKETKEFHARLCVIEERNRSK